MKQSYDSYKNMIVFYIFLIGIMMLTIMSYILSYNFHSKMDDKFVTLSKSLTTVISQEELRIVQLYQSRLIKNLKSYGVIEAIRKKDRKTLYKLIKPRYEELIKENKNFVVMHFHTADNKTLLRMHDVDYYDDDLSSFRDIVVDTNTNKHAHFGFEKGKHGYFYRIIVPIIDNNEHLGSVEFGLKLEYFTDNIKRLLPDMNFGLMFLTENLKDKNYKTLDKYSLIYDEDNFFKPLLEKINLHKNYNILQEGKHYYILSSNIYIKDYHDNDAINILFAIDITKFRNSLINQYLILLFIGVLTYALSFIIINMGFKKYISSLQKQSKKLQEYAKIVDEYVIVSSTDLKGYITYASEAFCKISGYTKKELLGSSHNLVKHPDMPQSVYKEMWNTLIREKVWHGELKNQKKDGTHYWVDAVISPVYNVEGILKGYTSVRQDITDKKKIEEISQKDKLTQIYNRLKLDEILESEIDRAKRYNTVFCVILMDIDKFKIVNDTFGHQAGDSVLIEVAQILSKSLRKTDTLGRWGGEEFMIICPGITIDGAVILAENIRQRIENYDFKIVGKLTGSFGISQYEKGENEEIIVKRCDEALYDSKHTGRNKVTYK